MLLRWVLTGTSAKDVCISSSRRVIEHARAWLLHTCVYNSIHDVLNI